MNNKPTLYQIITCISTVITIIFILVTAYTDSKVFFALYNLFFFLSAFLIYHEYKRKRLQKDENYRRKVGERKLKKKRRLTKLGAQYIVDYLKTALQIQNFTVSKEIKLKGDYPILSIFYVDDVNKKFALSVNENYSIHNYTDIDSFEVLKSVPTEARPFHIGRHTHRRNVPVYYAVIKIKLKNNLQTPYLTMNFESLTDVDNIIGTQDIIGTLEYIQNYNNNL